MIRGFASVAVLALGATVLGIACSQAALPPGTPPPEYETRPVEPWRPPSAAAPAAPLEPVDAPPAEPPLAPEDVSSDAGPPEASDAGGDAASEAGPF